MKVPPKRPQCAHCGLSQSRHLCQPLPPCLVLFVCMPRAPILWHPVARKTAAAPTRAKAPERHVDPWRLDVRVDVTGTGFIISPLNCDMGQQQDRAELPSDCMHPWSGCGLTVSDGKTKFIQTCTPVPMCKQKKKKHKHT